MALLKSSVPDRTSVLNIFNDMREAFGNGGIRMIREPHQTVASLTTIRTVCVTCFSYQSGGIRLSILIYGFRFT